MKTNSVRTLLLVAFAANLGFLGLTLVDYYAWDGAFWVPILVAWVIVMVITVLVGMFARTQDGVGIRVVERIYIREPAALPDASSMAPPVTVLPATPKPDPAQGPFTFNGYTLHARDVELKSGGTRTIWFFSKGTPKSGKPSAKPAGFHVGVNQRTGLPFLKRGTGADGEDLTPEAEAAYRPQCSALTDEGGQCRNSARADSKYCASHFGYQPPAIAQAQARRGDTRPRVKGARDTLPSVRRRSA